MSNQVLSDGVYQVAKIFFQDREIDNGLLRIEGGRIAELSAIKAPTADAVDLGDVAIVPAWVNAHTHLEFSNLKQPLGDSGIPFTQWLALVIKQRTLQPAGGDVKRQSIQMGLAESAAAGVGVVGEIATPVVDWDDYTNRFCDVHVFHEQLTRNVSLIDDKLLSCENWLTQPQNDQASNGSILNIGRANISPHSPYSVHPDLLERLVGLARRHNRALAIHIAETAAEIELLETQSGPFRDFLESIGAWYPESFTPTFKIIDYLRLLSQAPRTLVVHGNFLQPAEIDFIAQHANKMSVVFCPRTHRFFGHDPYPLDALLAAGINVAVGTDSRASNPNLSLFEELKEIRRLWPALSDQQILDMGTANGSKALGIPVATIAAGQPACFNMIESFHCSGLFGASARLRPLNCN